MHRILIWIANLDVFFVMFAFKLLDVLNIEALTFTSVLFSLFGLLSEVPGCSLEVLPWQLEIILRHLFNYFFHIHHHKVRAKVPITLCHRLDCYHVQEGLFQFIELVESIFTLSAFN